MAGSRFPAQPGPGHSAPIQAGLCQAAHELEHVASNGLSCFQKSKPPSKDNNRSSNLQSAQSAYGL